MKGKKRFVTILVLGMLSAIGPFSIDMYLPGFPAIADDLQTTVGQVSLSLSSFFIGISFGQILYGPLIDRFGRKIPLYIGLSVYLLASLGCVFATSVNALIVLRLCQALGGCVGMVASRAMVRDLFPVEENAKIFSSLMLVVGVSPIIAPTVGGYVAAAFGWHYIFVILAIMAVFVLLAIYLALPASKPADTTISLLPKPIIKNYLSVLREPQFVTYAFTGSIAAAGLYAYIAGSPYVFMEIFSVSEKQYGWIFALIAGGLIVSSQINSIMLRRHTSEQIIRVALCVQSLSGIALFIGTVYHGLGLTGTISLIFVFLCCQGFTFPNTSALSMAPFSRNAGSASALMGGIQMSIGALTSAIVSIFSNHTAVPMMAVMALCAVTSLCILFSGRRFIAYKTTSSAVAEKNAMMVTE